MTKFLNKISMSVSLAVVGLMTWAGFAHAAADADFASSTEALTTVITDNKGQALLFIAGIVGIALIIGLAIRVLFMGKRAIIGAVPGGRRRR